VLASTDVNAEIGVLFLAFIVEIAPYRAYALLTGVIHTILSGTIRTSAGLLMLFFSCFGMLRELSGFL